MAVKITQEYRIVVSKDVDAGTKYAAEELAKYLKAVGSVELPVVCDCTESAEKEIVVGCSNRCGTPSGVNLKNDGYVLRTVGDKLFIRGMNDRGNLYGVYGFLENVLGCRFFTEVVEKIPAMDVIEIPELDETVMPAFEFRNTTWHEISRKPFFSYKRGFNSIAGTPVTPMLAHSLCHTMFNYLSPDDYFDEHPEYFSMVEGRRIREMTQLCLTNPEVLEIVKKNLRKTILEHPECTIFSVSQMDWYNPCQCPECRRVDEEEGNHMGTMIRFVNACADSVAEEFPDVIIETLAYQYTRQAPKTRPRPNVCVCLCTIECCFTHPMRDDNHIAVPFRHLTTPGVTVQQDLRDWGKICKRMMIWDYTTNYRFYQAPNMNLHVLQDNMKFFLENGVTSLFEQGTGETISGEFGELRVYLISKLMWNVDGDVSAWMDEFLENYYGRKAAKPIRAYIDYLTDYVTRYEVHAGIYENPQDVFPNALIPAMDAFWDAAEAAAEDEDQLNRIQRSRMQVRFLKLQRKAHVDVDYQQQAEAYIADIKRFGIARIQEGKPLEKSFDQIRTGFLPGSTRAFWEPEPAFETKKY